MTKYMTRSIHEHRWVYLGELALVVSAKEQDVQLRRLEYCIECSSARVKFPTGWYELQGDASKEFLKHFDGDSAGEVVRPTPPEYRPRAPKKDRLGKSLADIVSLPIPSLFKK